MSGKRDLTKKYNELDELEQFRLIVVQLEVCRDLILSNDIQKSRIALILLDNAAEVILYRVAHEELEYDAYFRNIIPARFSVKQRITMERYFNAKLDFISSKEKIDKASVDMLRIPSHSGHP